MQSNKVISLMYHDSYKIEKCESGFKLAGADIYKIKPEVFEHQLQIIDNYLVTNKIDKNFVRLTFDDGGVSFYTIFAPILEKYSYRGYFFISTKFIGTEGFLNESMIKELDNRGHIIGAHSDSHRPRMNTLSQKELQDDWYNCTNKLQHILGHNVRHCSLPGGFMSESMIDVLTSLGYTDIYTSEATEKVREMGDIRIYGRYGIKESMTDDYVLSIVTSSRVRMNIKVRKMMLGIAKKIMGNTYVVIREKLLRLLGTS